MDAATLPRLPSRLTLGLIAALLFIVAFGVYGQSLRNDFVRFDDGLLIYENPMIRTISPQSIKTVFTSYDPELYIPLTFLSYQVDYQIGGTNAFVYHFHSLILHLLNAGLVVWLVFLLSSSGIGALVAGMLFAIHPLNTETVAWASALKDLQSTFFFLGSIIAYLYYRSENRPWQYWLSVGLFALGLLSKVLVITLPIVLLLLDWREGRRWSKETFKEKIPYLGLALLFGLIALFGKREVIVKTTLVETALMGAKSTMFYLGKLLWPANFSVLYPYTKSILLSSPDFFLPLIGVLILLGIAWYARRFSKDIPFAILFYLCTLFPTFFNFAKGGTGFFIASDRYAYIPMIGLLFLLAVAIRHLLARPAKRSERQTRMLAGVIIGLGLVLFLAHATYAQSLTWHDTQSLFSNVVRSYPDSYAAHNNLGNAYRRQGKLEEAIQEFKAALKDGGHTKAYDNLGAVYAKKGMLAEALDVFHKSIALDPQNAEPYLGLGIMYAGSGQPDKALEAYNNAIGIDPKNAQVYTNRGALLMDQGRVEEAVADYKRAIDAEPYLAQAHYNLAIAYTQQGDTENAIKEYESVAEIQPSFFQARLNLGILYAKFGRLKEAREQFVAVLKISPTNAAAKSAVEQIDRALEAQNGQN